jgi:hypothetical protein
MGWFAGTSDTKHFKPRLGLDFSKTSRRLASTDRELDLYHGINFSNIIASTNTDGCLIKAGTFSSRIAFATASQYGMAFYFNVTAATGTFRGMRLRIGSNNTSVATQSIDGLLAQVSAEAGADATTLNSAFFEIIPKGTNTVTTARVLLCNADSAAAQTMTTQIIGHFRVHTRGDETITDDEMLRLENEAVGGNGRQLDSFIRVKTATLSAGIKGAAYLIDGNDTSLLGTGFMRLGDIAGVASVTNGSYLNDISATTNAGYLRVDIGANVRYIALYEAKA